jgi:hypothetical protein
MNPNILYALQLDRFVKILHYKNCLKNHDIEENYYPQYSNDNCEILDKDQS